MEKTHTSNFITMFEITNISTFKMVIFYPATLLTIGWTLFLGMIDTTGMPPWLAAVVPVMLIGYLVFDKYEDAKRKRQININKKKAEEMALDKFKAGEIGVDELNKIIDED